MVEAVDENPCTEWLASVRLEHGYDQNGVAVAGVPARSPRPPRPVGPPESPELAKALLVGAAAVTHLRLSLLNSQTTSNHHDSPRWTTMKTLSLLNCCPLCWCKLLICNHNPTASTSSLGMLCGLYNCCCTSCLCIWVLPLLGCNLLCRLAFWICR